jgi:hypothetical protein
VRVDENGVGIRFDRRSGKDRRADLDRRRKVIDRRRNKVKKSGARRKTSGNPVKFASLAPKETPTQKPPSG